MVVTNDIDSLNFSDLDPETNTSYRVLANYSDGSTNISQTFVRSPQILSLGDVTREEVAWEMIVGVNKYNVEKTFSISGDWFSVGLVETNRYPLTQDGTNAYYRIWIAE